VPRIADSGGWSRWPSKEIGKRLDGRESATHLEGQRLVRQHICLHLLVQLPDLLLTQFGQRVEGRSNRGCRLEAASRNERRQLDSARDAHRLSEPLTEADGTGGSGATPGSGLGSTSAAVATSFGAGTLGVGAAPFMRATEGEFIRAVRFSAAARSARRRCESSSARASLARTTAISERKTLHYAALSSRLPTEPARASHTPPPAPPHTSRRAGPEEGLARHVAQCSLTWPSSRPPSGAMRLLIQSPSRPHEP
jgi:hypothetical protein